MRVGDGFNFTIQHHLKFNNLQKLPVGAQSNSECKAYGRGYYHTCVIKKIKQQRNLASMKFCITCFKTTNQLLPCKTSQPLEVVSSCRHRWTSVANNLANRWRNEEAHRLKWLSKRGKRTCPKNMISLGRNSDISSSIEVKNWLQNTSCCISGLLSMLWGLGGPLPCKKNGS